MQHRESRNSKILTRIIITILIFISWAGLPLVIQLLILGFSIFKFMKLASGGFSCTHCWKGWFVTLPAVVFAFIQLPIPLYIIGILFVWYELLLPSKRAATY